MRFVLGAGRTRVTVNSGSTTFVGRGFPAANVPRERMVCDQAGSRSAWVKVTGYQVDSLPGGQTDDCRFQVLLAE
jgi:hypothetical protein